MAVRELARAGKKVTVLEARDRIGGRIYPLPVEEFGYEAQGGGEFVHGDAKITCELLAECGATLTHATEWWSVMDGEAKTHQPSPMDPRLLEKLAELPEDMTLAQFFDKFFLGDEYRDMREHAYYWVEGYDAGDPKRSSVFALRDDALSPREWLQRNIKEGYGAALRHLERQCKDAGVEILLNQKVAQIDISGEGVEVTVAKGATFRADAAVVTVPLPCIADIRFVPEIPEKKAAATAIGFGAVIKILIRFSEKWWAGAREKDFERLFFMFSREKIRTWWTQYPEPHLTLTGWLAGPAATAYSGMPQDRILDLAYESLSNIFEIGLDELREKTLASRVVDWPADPYAKGGYSYTTPESPEAIEELKRPVAGKLYFAGEALNRDDLVATVDAALQSGFDTATRLLESAQ
jgi:monoamine oxidase